LYISISSSESNEFQEGMRSDNGRHLLAARSALDWNLGVIDLDGVKVIDGRNGGTCLCQGACLSDTCAMFVPAPQLRSRAIGNRLEKENVAWVVPGEQFRISCVADLGWLGVMVNIGHVRRWLEDVQFCPHLLSSCAGRANAVFIERVGTLAIRTQRVAANYPGTLRLSQVRDSLRTQLLDSVFFVLQSLEPEGNARPGRPRLGRHEILKRVLALMEERIDQPLHVGDLCAEACVSVATLQNMFSEQFGVSPHRYLMLRRLHSIHASLREAGPSDTVSSICARFGVWDFGRFATQHRRHFGLLPSQVLGTRHSLRQHQVPVSMQSD
jgi:AraC family ethanolamine operon transcriptional activator